MRWVVTVGGFALLALLFIQIGPGQVLALLGTMGWNLAIVAAIFAGHEAVRAFALSRCLPAGSRPPFRRLLLIRFLGEAVKTLTHSGPFLSEPMRAWMLARDEVESVHAYGAAVSELIANSIISALVTVLVLAALVWAFDVRGPLLTLSWVLIAVSFVYVALAAVALARRVYVIGAVLGVVAKLPLIRSRLNVDAGEVRRMEDLILHVLRDRPVILGQLVVLQFVAQAILVLDAYWALASMDVPISAGRALVVEALTKMANVIQFVGASEAGYAIVFNWLGMTAAVGFTLSLVKRVRSMTVAAIGLVLLSQFDRPSLAPARAPTSPR